MDFNFIKIIMGSIFLFLLSSLNTSVAYAVEPNTINKNPELDINTNNIDSGIKLKSKEVNIIYSNPNWMFNSHWHMNHIITLFDYFNNNPGTILPLTVGKSVLYDGQRYFFPEKQFSKVGQVINFLNKVKSPEIEILENNFPVLISSFEINFQYPFKNHFNWMKIMEKDTNPGSRFSDTQKVYGKLLRYKDKKHGSILCLELKENFPDNIKISGFRRNWGLISEIVTADDKVNLYSWGKQLIKGEQIQYELNSIKSNYKKNNTNSVSVPLFLHPGNIVKPLSNDKQNEFSAKTIKDMNPTAIVPSRGELGIGSDKLGLIVKKYNIPYIAANLFYKKESNKKVFPRFILKEVNGLKVAIIGIVGREELGILPAQVRSHWTVDLPWKALENTVLSIKQQLGKLPDLTVVLTSVKNGSDYNKLLQVENIDIIIGMFNRWDLLKTSESIKIDKLLNRENSRNIHTILNVRQSFYSVGSINVLFNKDSINQSYNLAEINHFSYPVLDTGSVDEKIEKIVLKLEEEEVLKNSRILLPDIAPILKEMPNLHHLVWGDSILMDNNYTEYEKHFPGRFTVGLWMRFITSILLSETNAEVVVSRNLPRNSNMIGEITQENLNDWLKSTDALIEIQLSGLELIKLCERVNNQKAGSNIHPSKNIYTSGMDPKTFMIAGRKINIKETYKVITTDYVITIDDLKHVFKNSANTNKFLKTKKNLYKSNSDGKQLLLRDVIFEHIKKLSDSKTKEFDYKNVNKIKEILSRDAKEKTGQWRFTVKELSVTGQQYNNTSNYENFATTRETRLTTPKNFSLMGKSDIALTYDGPSISWENNLKTDLQRVELNIKGQDIPPQESADDILFSTEIRLNAVSLKLQNKNISITPFIGQSYDTEFTPVPNPVENDSDNTFPHQQILRSSVGFVSYPGMFLREIRFGFLYQNDISDKDRHEDYGVSAGYELNLPLIKPLMLDSKLDLKYYIPDSDDNRNTDLGLILSWSNKLLVPIVKNISVFCFADIYMVKGKVESNEEIGGSYIFGGGLKFSFIQKF